MCVIIHKPAKIALDPEVVEKACKQNSHGWGVMWADGGKLHVRKGLKTEDAVVVMKSLESVTAVFHARIGTSGTKDVANCHPFPVAEGIWMMHNGIIGLPSVNPKMCDSWHFARLIARPIVEKFPTAYGNEIMIKSFEYLIGSSNKLVFLRADGKEMIVNKRAGSEKWGCWLSNMNGLKNEKPYSYTSHADDYLADYRERRGQHFINTSPIPHVGLPDNRHYCQTCGVFVQQDGIPWRNGPEKYRYICCFCDAQMKWNTAKRERMAPKSLADLSNRTFKEMLYILMEFPERTAGILANMEFSEENDLTVEGLPE